MNDFFKCTQIAIFWYSVPNCYRLTCVLHKYLSENDAKKRVFISFVFQCFSKIDWTNCILKKEKKFEFCIFIVNTSKSNWIVRFFVFSFWLKNWESHNSSLLFPVVQKFLHKTLCVIYTHFSFSSEISALFLKKKWSNIFPQKLRLAQFEGEQFSCFLRYFYIFFAFFVNFAIFNEKWPSLQKF